MIFAPPASIRDPASIRTNEVWPPACIWDPASIRGNMVWTLRLRDTSPTGHFAY